MNPLFHAKVLSIYSLLLLVLAILCINGQENAQLFPLMKYSVSVVVEGVKEGSNLPSSFVFSRANMFTLSPTSGSKFYVTETSLTKIRIIDASTGITTLTKELNAQPYAVAVSPTNNDLIFTVREGDDEVIYRLDSNGVQTILAGTKTVYGIGYSGDDGLATNAKLNGPSGIAISSIGEVYFADSRNHAIRKISLNGKISTIAGNGTFGFYGDGGLAKNALLFEPLGIAITPNDELLIADSKNNVIRKIDSKGLISTIAGNATLKGYNGDGILATTASLDTPYSVYYHAASGEIYILDTMNAIVRKVSNNGIISTVAGVPNHYGYIGEKGIPATEALFSVPSSVVITNSGEMFIADSVVIRKVDTKGLISTITMEPDFTGDIKKFTGNGYNSQPAFVFSASHSCTNILGETFIADSGLHNIRKIDSKGIISLYAGSNRGDSGYSGDGGDALDAKFNQPTRIACAPNGDIYISDMFNEAIRKVFAENQTVITVASGFGAHSVILTPKGELLVADRYKHVIRKISNNGVVSIIAGVDGNGGFNGDGLALKTQFSGPADIALAPNGDLYIADFDNYRIRKLSSNGNITTVAGNGETSDIVQDFGLATNTSLTYPQAVAVSKDGEVFFSIGGTILKITSTGILVKIFGSDNSSIPESYSDARTMSMGTVGLYFTPNGDLLVSGGFTSRIVKISKQSCSENSIPDNSNTFCLPLCFGTLYNDALVCSGNGKCSSPNKCSCKSGFSGEKCGDRVVPQSSKSTAGEKTFKLSSADRVGKNDGIIFALIMIVCWIVL